MRSSEKKESTVSDSGKGCSDSPGERRKKALPSDAQTENKTEAYNIRKMKVCHRPILQGLLTQPPLYVRCNRTPCISVARKTFPHVSKSSESYHIVYRQERTGLPSRCAEARHRLCCQRTPAVLTARTWQCVRDPSRTHALHSRSSDVQSQPRQQHSRRQGCARPLR